MTNRHMLSSTVLLMTWLLLGAGYAQTTKLATKSQPTGQIVPVLTQQIGPAFVMAPDEQGDYGFGAVLQTLELHRLGSSSVFPTAPSITRSGTAETATQPEPELSNAPGATPKPAGECGPSWLGGCWNVHQPQRGFGETFKSPTFYPLFFGLLATNAIDIEATRASGCGEASEFGKKPSRLEQYGQDFAADAAVGTMAFFLHRAHIKVIPQAMLGYGIGIHIHGAIRGFHANCR